MSDLPVYTLEQLEAQEPFVVDAFTSDDAVRLGLIGIDVIRDLGADLAIDIVIGDHLAFRAHTGTTGAFNVEWLEGKALVARHYGVASLLARRRLEAAGRTVADDGLDDAHRAHGGSIPILVDGSVVATITMSGEPDVVDHQASTEAQRRFLA